MPHRSRFTRSLLWAIAPLLVAVGCSDDPPMNTFEARGPNADSILTLTWWLWVIMAFFFVFVVGGGIALAIKFRVKPEDYDPTDLPAQTHGNPMLEWAWTAAPAVLLIVLAVPSVNLVWQLEEKNDGAANELDVMVIGRQWWWEYRYDVDGDGFFADADGDGQIWGPNGEGGDKDDIEWPLQQALDPDDLSVANELVIPADTQVDLWITSGDVIHSYWIPRLNGKRDAVPGRLHTWNIEAYDPGKYTGWCTEFCGLSHARMRMSVIALDRADYESWYQNQLQPADAFTMDAPVAPAADASDEEKAAYEAALEEYNAAAEEFGGLEAVAGQALFNANCTACHIVRSDSFEYAENFDPGDEVLKSGAAPNLTHFATRSVFAGAIYGQYVTDGSGAAYDPNDDDLDVASYLQLSENGRFNVAELRRWISNAPSRKDMAPDNQRGMPAFPALTETDIDNLVAYLATLD